MYGVKSDSSIRRQFILTVCRRLVQPRRMELAHHVRSPRHFSPLCLLQWSEKKLRECQKNFSGAMWKRFKHQHSPVSCGCITLVFFRCHVGFNDGPSWEQVFRHKLHSVACRCRYSTKLFFLPPFVLKLASLHLGSCLALASKQT